MPAGAATHRPADRNQAAAQARPNPLPVHQIPVDRNRRQAPPDRKNRPHPRPRAGPKIPAPPKHLAAKIRPTWASRFICWTKREHFWRSPAIAVPTRRPLRAPAASSIRKTKFSVTDPILSTWMRPPCPPAISISAWRSMAQATRSTRSRFPHRPRQAYRSHPVLLPLLPALPDWVSWPPDVAGAKNS